LIDYFVAHGCTFGELPNVVETPYGLRRIRFLVNPAGTQFVTITDLEDDESLPETIYANWEALLGVELPRNGLAC
jgi:hypothetical protein